MGHGQIESLGDAQRYFDGLAVTESPAVLHKNEPVDVDAVVTAFHAVRDARGDRGSPDLYVADPVRNADFLAKCRELGLTASDYTLNKTLMNARRNGLLSGLHSVRTTVNYEDYAFASEFAARELQYKTGASIDDILCDLCLSSRFDSIARKITDGYSTFEYRWAILSIRKAGRKAPENAEFVMPPFSDGFRLATGDLQTIPDTIGVYILYEGKKPLYARSVTKLRHGIGQHRSSPLMSAVVDKLWRPDPAAFLVSYAALDAERLLKRVEWHVVRQEKPLFNVARAA
jgi:hypothetical protein